MNVLISAGGTQEDIDSVRSITNKATGRLGSIIADAFTAAGAQVTYLCGEGAVLPSSAPFELRSIRTVAELGTAMEALLHARPYACVIHSMAVSDYTAQGILPMDSLAERLERLFQTQNNPSPDMANRIRDTIEDCIKAPEAHKISSKAGDIALLLTKTPKIIGRIKAIQPDTLLVGFKLLSHVPEEELVQAGLGLLRKNACDFVLANDLAHIHGDRHKGILLDRNGIVCRAETKQEIARLICGSVLERVKHP